MKPVIKDYNLEEKQITLALDTGGEIDLWMNEELFTYYGPGCDLELHFTDDAIKDIYFRVGGSPVTVLQIIQWAQDNIDDLHAEAEEEAEYARELASPYWTGRV